MAEFKQFICDGCGAKRGEANHWYRILVDNTGIHCYHWANCDEPANWYKDYCGQACAQKAISEWMGRVKHDS